eukprot:3086802-Ditylum_brightwellii.AAC.1
MEFPKSCKVCPVEPEWAKNPDNSTNKIPRDSIAKLVELYNDGKANKKHKDHQLTITVPKIKAFFSMVPSKMAKAIDLAEVEQTELNEQETDGTATPDLSEDNDNYI